MSVFIFLFVTLASAHTAAWASGMYCRGGNTTTENQNTNLVVEPLYDLPKSSWWFQHDRSCDLFPPPPGEFLELPAGGSFTFVTDWPDGQEHPEDYRAEDGNECLSDGALHASNLSATAGTALGISYESDIKDVTLENLVVFTTLENTPWKRLATYDVATALPACPPAGCTGAWLWVPHLCGTSNMYMQGFKYNVMGATSSISLAKAKPPVMCANGTSKVERDGNNIETQFPILPGYNTDCGWETGAQNDIFESAEASPSTASVPEFTTLSSKQTSTTSPSNAVSSQSMVESSTQVSVAATLATVIKP
ncbi:hypothetical protein BKA61DRAFT_719509 [Leptodontidium sp. MPI-SDFR-AT-0119]|nr:hypothetical protein BKA61DRAFT_719509 [Leptodontidium sp. MPI-SDFR-AT-0119]